MIWWLYEPIMVTFEQISTKRSWNEQSRIDAAGLFTACLNFGFIITLVIVDQILAYTYSATVKLQSSYGDVLKAYNEIELILDTLEHKVQNDIDAYHNKWYNEAVNLGQNVNVLPSKPRTCAHQLLRDNTPADTPEAYYRRCVTVKFVDHLIAELKRRFNKENDAITKGLYLVPPVMIDHIGNHGAGSWKLEFAKFVEQYEDDLPSPRLLAAEMDLWETFWTRRFVGVLPERVLSTLKSCEESTFPNLYCCLRLLGTVPVTQCECE